MQGYRGCSLSLNFILYLLIPECLVYWSCAQFKTKGGSALKEYCAALTKEDCRHQRNYFIACKKVRILNTFSLLAGVSFLVCFSLPFKKLVKQRCL